MKMTGTGGAPARLSRRALLGFSTAAIALFLCAGTVLMRQGRGTWILKEDDF